MNIENVQFDLMMLGAHQVVKGKMIDVDDTGCTIELANEHHHSYPLHVIQHITHG